mgnify:CR=1 FL=1
MVLPVDSSLWWVLPYGTPKPFTSAPYVRHHLAMRHAPYIDVPMTAHEYWQCKNRTRVPPNGMSFRGRPIIGRSTPYAMTGQVYRM